MACTSIRAYYVPEGQAFWLSQIRAHQREQSGGVRLYYAGTGYQRGTGFGNIFGSILRSIVPVAKAGLKVMRPVAKTAVRDLASTGISALSDAIEGGGDPVQKLKSGAKSAAAKAVRGMMSELAPSSSTSRKRKAGGGGGGGKKKRKRGGGGGQKGGRLGFGIVGTKPVHCKKRRKKRSQPLNFGL